MTTEYKISAADDIVAVLRSALEQAKNLAPGQPAGLVDDALGLLPEIERLVQLGQSHELAVKAGRQAVNDLRHCAAEIGSKSPLVGAQGWIERCARHESILGNVSHYRTELQRKERALDRIAEMTCSTSWEEACPNVADLMAKLEALEQRRPSHLVNKVTGRVTVAHPNADPEVWDNLFPEWVPGYSSQKQS